MNCLSFTRRWGLLLLIAGLTGSASAPGDPLSAVQLLREGGCGGVVQAARPLRHNAVLDRAAQRWAAGMALPAAAARSGYGTKSSTMGVHVSGPDASMLELLRRSECRSVTSQALREMGFYRRGQDFWLVLASDYMTPAASGAPAISHLPARPRAVDSPVLSRRALELVNEVRARGTRCGGRSFAPARPMRLSASLGGVAFGHATDMAVHNYFEHEDLAGQSPADRVRAVGYKEKLVGENIAYGPKSVEEVVQGWLDSPGHCENIMDPRFGEMGIAFAAGRNTRRGLYWVQLLAAPRA